MIYKLLLHHWKEKQRSSYWQKSIALNILMGIFGLYLISVVLMLGFFADKIISEAFREKDVVEVFTGLLFYYFSFDLILRFLLQSIPTVSIQPYLTLPIKKSSLLHYPLIKSITGFFNLLAIILFLPFFIKVVCASHSFSFCSAWLIALFSLIFINNFLNFSLKKYFSKKPLVVLFLLAITALLIYLEISKTILFSGYFSDALLYISDNPFLVTVPIAFLVLSYYFAYILLKRNAYIEDKLSNKAIRTNDFLFLKQFGEIGELIGVEIKMILRNKRPRSLLYVSAFFMLYGFLFYKQENLDKEMILILAGLFITSIFSLNYGQFLFAWEGSYFDCYMTNKISVTNYIKSKFLFISGSCLIGFIITLPYAILSYKIAIINAALLLYNIGITSIMLMLFCTFNSTRIDLGKSQFMNYQGTGFTQFLIIIPIMGIPTLIFLLFDYLGIPQYSIVALGLLGVIGILFNKFLLQAVVKQLLKRKYKMTFGFRQK